MNILKHMRNYRNWKYGAGDNRNVERLYVKFNMKNPVFLVICYFIHRISCILKFTCSSEFCIK